AAWAELRLRCKYRLSRGEPPPTRAVSVPIVAARLSPSPRHRRLVESRDRCPPRRLGISDRTAARRPRARQRETRLRAQVRRAQVWAVRHEPSVEVRVAERPAPAREAPARAPVPARVRVRAPAPVRGAAVLPAVRGSAPRCTRAPAALSGAARASERRTRFPRAPADSWHRRSEGCARRYRSWRTRGYLGL